MAALATLDDVKAVARDNSNIQGLHQANQAVINADALADQLIKVERYGNLTKDAQSYFMAHVLALAFTESGGKGPLSSESIGGISQSFTLPYLNQKTVLASTQYGLMFLELRDHINIPAVIVHPT